MNEQHQNHPYDRAKNLIVFWEGTAYPVPYPVESDVDIVETGSTIVITYRTTGLAANIFEFENDVESSEALRLLTQLIGEEGEPVSMSDIATLQSIAVTCRNTTCRNTKIGAMSVVHLRRDRGVWRVSRTTPDAIWAFPRLSSADSIDSVERSAERDANEQGEFIVQVVYRHRRTSDCIVRKATT